MSLPEEGTGVSTLKGGLFMVRGIPTLKENSVCGKGEACCTLKTGHGLRKGYPNPKSGFVEGSRDCVGIGVPASGGPSERRGSHFGEGGPCTEETLGGKEGLAAEDWAWGEGF